MIYTLPTALEIGETEYEIRSDFRAILDILTAMNDVEMNDQEKAFVVLKIFYPNFKDIPSKDIKEAQEKLIWFIQCGDESDSSRRTPKLMDWEQDFPYIVSPINRVIGQEIRAMPYLHWWTFISAYYEIGDCFFSQIVRIRQKKAEGKLKDKADREFYRKNRAIIDFKMQYTMEDLDILKQWGGVTRAE